MPSPAVSVIIPAFNAERFLRRAVASVCAQTYRDWEIVIVNDASADATGEVAEALQGEMPERVQCIHQSRGGASVARNTGIAAARGRFLAFLDADDEFLPTKLERQMALLDRAPELGLVFSDFTSIHLDGRVELRRFDDPQLLIRQAASREIAPSMHLLDDAFFSVLLRQHFVSPITAVVRRQVLGDTLRFPAGLQYWEERVFFLEVARATPAGYIDEPLAINHFVPGSLSRTDTVHNLVHRVRALEEISRRFGGAGPAARKVIRCEMRDCVEALALARYRKGEFAEAATLFARMLRLKPALRPGIHWLQAAVRAIRWRSPQAVTDTPYTDR